MTKKWYRIFWKHKDSSAQGQGEGTFSEEMAEVMISVGMEYWYRELFAARAGYFHESDTKGGRKYFTVGLGFRYQKFGLDFSYLVPTKQNHPLAETIRFTLLFDFNKGTDDAETDTAN